MKKIPEAVGPYSAFRKAGDFLYISGQIAINPENQKVEAVTVEDQARQVLENLKAILENNGLTTGNVIKTTVLLDNIDDFISFLCNSDFSCCDSYEDSWKFIKGGKHSLERYSNLGLCFLPSN